MKTVCGCRCHAEAPTELAKAAVLKLGGLPPSPLDDAIAAHILQIAGIGDWDALSRILVAPIGEAAAQGVLMGFTDLGVEDDHNAFRLANEDAVQWATERAAELVGRRRVGANLDLVHNAPPWAITETTRDGLREIVTQALQDGWSADELAQQVQESWLFDATRAETIARTELAMAHVAGTMAAWRRSGVVTGKKSLMSDLHDRDDICDINASVGTIPLDASFPSGDDGPPYHPNCECVLVADVSEDVPVEKRTRRLHFLRLAPGWKAASLLVTKVARTVTVWRVEHRETGEGPYNNQRGGLGVFVPPDELTPEAINSRVDRQPRPQFKTGIRETDNFGFASVEQYKAWFSPTERAQLAKNGFVVRQYSVPAHMVKRDSVQVAFPRARAESQPMDYDAEVRTPAANPYFTPGGEPRIPAGGPGGGEWTK